MSFGETIFLFILALVVFGPKKLPEIARQVGKYLNEFKRASNEFKSQIEQEIAHMEVENRQTILPPSAPVEGTTSRTLSPASTEVGETPPSSETPAVDVSATLAASAESPSLSGANGGSPVVATEAIAPSQEGTPEEVTSTEETSNTSQESHA